MTYVGLLIAGFVGMLMFWMLAAWLWTAAAARGESMAKDPPPSPPHTGALPMQFRRLQPDAVALLARQRQAPNTVENRVRRNCMVVDIAEPDGGSAQTTKVVSDDEREIERRATGVFFVQADSPRPRDPHSSQDLATQPYDRARHRNPPTIR